MHPSHYYTKPGEGRHRRPESGHAMRMLEPVLADRPVTERIQVEPPAPKGRPPKRPITEELLKQIEAAILAGDTFVNQAKQSGFTFDALSKAWRNSGRRVRGVRQRGLPEVILIETIHEFALWCERRGMNIKKSPDKRIVWCIQIMECGRFNYRAIRKTEKSFSFSNGVAALFKTFIKERENSRSSDCVYTGGESGL